MRAVLLLTTLWVIGCDSREGEREAHCGELLAFFHRDVDAERDLVLARGPDEAYLAALGLSEPLRDPRAVAVAKNAGLDIDASFRRDVEKAKASFADNVRRTTEGLHTRADARLVAACRALSDDARCVDEYPAAMARRNRQLRACPPSDQPCRDRVLSSWRAEHPDCHRLDEWIDALVNGAL